MTTALQIGLPLVTRTDDGRLRIYVHRHDLALLLVAAGHVVMADPETTDATRLAAVGSCLIAALPEEEQAVVRDYLRVLRSAIRRWSVPTDGCEGRESASPSAVALAL